MPGLRRRTHTTHHKLKPVRIGCRLLSICLLFGVPLGGLVYVGSEARANRASSLEIELEGLELLRPAAKLLEAQLELEMQRVITNQRNHPWVAQLTDARDAVADAVLDGDVAPALRQHAEVSQVLGEVERALDSDGSTQEADTASAPVAALVSMFDTVASTAKLSQESDFASYYLSLSVTSTLPEVLDNAANLTRLGLDALRTDRFTAEVRTRLIALTTALEEDIRALDRHVTNVSKAGSPALNGSLHAPLLRLASATLQLLDAGEKLGRDAVVKPHADELNAHVAETLGAAFALMSEAMDRLEGHLADLLAEQRREQKLVNTLSVTVLLVLGVLFAATAADLRARRAAENALVHQVGHDPLTGLANRRLFRDELARACASASRSDTFVGVLFLDLDDFKLVNDRLGHEAGDALLLEVAARLRRTVRSTDVAARLGGDEFAVVLNHLRNHNDAELVANALLAALREPMEIADRRVGVHASIGVSVADGHADADVLLANADAAMYAAKQRGKGEVEVFRPETAVVDSPGFRMSDLHNALENGELRLHYQPIVAMGRGDTIGFEALLRWAQPSAGLVSPATFIPYAERTDLIVPIGRWVLIEACHQTAAWRLAHGRDDLVISVNVSARQLATDAITDDVRDALALSGLPASALVLEITESTAVSGRVDLRKRLDDIRRLGVRVAIDDFGTGFSSLSYLADLPADTIKLDKSFVDRLGVDTGEELVRTMIDLIGRLGYQSLAEGIETEHQADLLVRFGCDLGQGFLMSRPLPADEVDTLLSSASLSSSEPITAGDVT